MAVEPSVLTPALVPPVASAPVVSVVIPCLNEAENVGQCVGLARAILEEHGLSGEIIVVDNGSDDGSGEIASAAGALVIEEPRRGYGSAYLAGFAAERGDYIVMFAVGQSDDFGVLTKFV